MRDFARLALGFEYPRPGLLAELRQAQAEMENRDAARAFSRFVDAVGELELAEWEELHTRTLDINPMVAPYVGWVTWGENYKRGSFMAEMKVALDDEGVPSNGELPDHLEPVLRYLAVADEPLPSLVEVLPSSLVKMTKKLETSDAESPYLDLLKAIATEAESIEALAGGVR